MAAYIIPAVATGAEKLANSGALKSAVKALQTQAPAVYTKLKGLTSPGSKVITPETVAAVATKQRDPMLMQNLIGQMFQAGASVELLQRTLPHFTQQDLEEVQSRYVSYVDMTSKNTAKVSIHPDAQPGFPAFLANDITWLSRKLSLTSDELARLRNILTWLDDETVAAYQKDARSRGIVPV